MSLRLRPDGTILCAALHPEQIGDIYIPDCISEILTGCTGFTPILITDPEPIHSTHGKWWINPESKVELLEALRLLEIYGLTRDF